MNRTQIVLAIVLVDFLALTVWAVVQMGGLVAAFAVITTNPATILLTVDLLLALSIACTMIWMDAKQRSINPLPYLALTLATGSAGPLAYLIRRQRS